MSINLGDFRARNSKRKGSAKRDVDTLIDLVEQMHNRLVSRTYHSEECSHKMTYSHSNGMGVPCTCGLTKLRNTIAYDFDKHLRRKQSVLYESGLVEVPTLAEIYE